MVTDGIQDDVMGEVSSLADHQHTCILVDALFLALHGSGCDIDRLVLLVAIYATYIGYVELAEPVRVGGVMCNGEPQR